jgi:hypothetical protein
MYQIVGRLKSNKKGWDLEVQVITGTALALQNSYNCYIYKGFD